MSIDRIYREFFGFSLIIFSLFLLASVLTFSAQDNVVNIFNENTTYQNNFNTCDFIFVPLELSLQFEKSIPQSYK